MTSSTMTAMYDARGAAEAARDGLVDLGVDRDEIEIHGTGGDAAEPREETGFWAGLTGFLFPDEDRHLYGEGIRRGGWLLSAIVPDDMRIRAQDVLELSDPIDLDDRSVTWEETGWIAPRPDTVETDAAEYEPRSARPGRGAPVTGDEDQGAAIARLEEEMGEGPRKEAEIRRRVRSYRREDSIDSPPIGVRPGDVLPRPF